MAVPDRLARLILRTYPPAWRHRYGAEMLALIDARPNAWSHVLDLARSSAGEWVARTRRAARPAIVAALIWTASRLGGAFAASLSVWLVGSVLAAGLAAVFREGTAVSMTWVFAGDLALFARLAIGMALSLRDGSIPRPRVGPRELWFWVAWMVASSAMHQWVRGEADLNVLMNWAWFNACQSHTLTTQRLVEARKQLTAATGGLADARRELWRLDRLREKGLPVPDQEMSTVLTQEMACLHDVQHWRAAVRKLEHPW
jgi:hypothetical protein